MNLHEFQAKAIFAKAGMPVPKSITVDSHAAASSVCKDLPLAKWIVKAQVHAGGRGKAGGIKVCENQAEIDTAVKNLLGQHLVTYQTDAKGQLIQYLLIEEPCAIERELYLGAVIDRSSGLIALMASAEGGVDIEQVAASHPEKIAKVFVEPSLGLLPYQARYLAKNLDLTPAAHKQFMLLCQQLYRLFVSHDLSLVEINPLALTKDGNILCLDGKVNVDDNALYRQSELAAMRDTSQEDAREVRARKWDLNYIALDGSIGCMVNGAGLAMATMDLIKHHGGFPANFLDVGGGATKERVTEAFKIILADDKVKAVFVNIFGGIVRCDLIAEGIIQAVSEVGITLPVVVRLEGNQAEAAREILSKSGLNIIAASSLTDAAKAAVANAGAKA